MDIPDYDLHPLWRAFDLAVTLIVLVILIVGVCVIWYGVLFW